MAPPYPQAGAQGREDQGGQAVSAQQQLHTHTWELHALPSRVSLLSFLHNESFVGSGSLLGSGSSRCPS